VSAGGTLTPDASGRAPGRGAYVCREPGCLDAALRRRGFSRALRAPVRVPDDLRTPERAG
jgi:predicted RNA-binding protein YlxR (DUF448 family)